MKYRSQINQDTESTKFAHKKSLGQNFLTSAVVPGYMCDAAEIKTGDLVFEIGPGTGMLTKTLLERGAIVTTVEADERAIAKLETDFASAITSGQLTIHHGDAREITPLKLGFKPYSFKIVANIPYYLSGFLLRSALETENQPKSLTFLIQKELASRITRDPKESLLSLSVKAFGEPRYYKNISRGHFNPQPKVDSAILLIQNINRRNFTQITTSDFFEILHLGLGKKRKQLATNLSERFDRDLVVRTLADLNLSPTIRGEDVKLDNWLKITHRLIN